MKTGAFVVSLVFVLTLMAFMAPSARADWPQYQGPNRDGISPEKGLARSWPEDGPKTLWTVPLGIGFAAPAVVDGKVYILDRIEQVPDAPRKKSKPRGGGRGGNGQDRDDRDRNADNETKSKTVKGGKEKDVLRCLDLESGEELWKLEFDAPGKVGHNGSRTTPTVAEGHVYAVGVKGDLYCVDISERKLVWHRNIVKDFEVDKLSYGMAQSPVVHGDLLLISPQKGDTSVAALKRSNGETVWKAGKLGLGHYTLPVITTLDGVEQIVMIGSSDRKLENLGKIAGISLEDGKILWSIVTKWQCHLPIPHALPLPEDRLFITGGYKAGSVMLQVKREGIFFKEFNAKELFATMDCGSQIHQPLFYKDHIYANSNSNEVQDGMICMTLDGEVKWRTGKGGELPNFERGTLILADDMIINLDGKTGKLHLIEPSPDKYRESAQAQVLGGKKIWAPMALSQGKLLLRDMKEMKCLDLRNP
ncbi:PQQ-binding-like beta-propeller repeat protein [Candidatus Hydrogenedentota bacterium]